MDSSAGNAVGATAGPGQAPPSQPRRRAGKKRGPKSQFTKEKIEELGALIAKGMPEKFACALLDVGFEAFQKAKQRDPQIVHAIQKRQAEFMSAALDGIAAGLPGWSGMRWILQTRHAADFGGGDVLVSQTNIQQHNHNAVTLTPDLLAKMQDYARLTFSKPRA